MAAAYLALDTTYRTALAAHDIRVLTAAGDVRRARESLARKPSSARCAARLAAAIRAYADECMARDAFLAR